MNDTAAHQQVLAVNDMLPPNTGESFDDWMNRAVKEELITNQERMAGNRCIWAETPAAAIAKCHEFLKRNAIPA